jgi:hypothetical protein
MSHLEQALRELEIATAAAFSLDDIDRARAVLNRRSQAIARLHEFRDAAAPLSPEARREVLSRLESAARAGEVARQELTRSKRQVTAEWSRWNQVHRALGSAKGAGATRIDYCG